MHVYIIVTVDLDLPPSMLPALKVVQFSVLSLQPVRTPINKSPVSDDSIDLQVKVKTCKVVNRERVVVGNQHIP